MGHPLICVPGMPVRRNLHQRAAYIATCRQGLNEKQQHCHKRSFFGMFNYFPSQKDVGNDSNAQTAQPTSLMLMVASFA
jgi:hypothetical protein